MFGSLLILKSYELEDTDDELSYWVVVDKVKKPNQLLEITMKPLNSNFEDLSDKPILVYESVIYFEAYVHVIKALASLRSIPFEAELVNLDKSQLKTHSVEDLKMRLPPSNFQKLHDTSEVTKSLMYAKEDKYTYQLLDVAKLKVNPSQLEAVKLGLENKIALIQGPPGTGKSYVGILLAKIFMSNLSKGPLVVICYTNHALDTFLEGLLQFTHKIVRIGGRSRSTELEPYNLNNIKSHLSEIGARDKRIYENMKELQFRLRNSESKSECNKILKNIKNLHELESLQIISKVNLVNYNSATIEKS